MKALVLHVQSRRARYPSALLNVFVMPCVMMLATGCVGDRATAPKLRSPNEVLGRITVSPVSTLIAVGDTQHLDVTGQSLAGTAISSFDSVRYVLLNSSDSLRVRLSNTGTVTGRSESFGPILVNVFAYKDGVGRADQVYLMVTATRYSGLQLAFISSYDGTVPVGQEDYLVPVLYNPVTHDTVPDGFEVRYVPGSADSLHAAVWYPRLYVPQTIENYDPYSGTKETPYPQVGDWHAVKALVPEGTAWVHTSINAYGTTVQDSMLYHFTYQRYAEIALGISGLTISGDYADQTVTLAPGATVSFRNRIFRLGDAVRMTYTFDNPSAAVANDPPSTNGGDSGNVVDLGRLQSSSRRFMTAGTYKWTATVRGIPSPWNEEVVSGTIVIK